MMLDRMRSPGEAGMHDEDKVDDVVLALLHLNVFKDHGVDRAWKSFDWDSMNRAVRSWSDH